MKLAVNLYLIALVTASAETAEYADRHGLDLAVLRDVLDAGPMASEVSRGKPAKLVAGDSPCRPGWRRPLQYRSGRRAGQEQRHGHAAPDISREWFIEAEALGYGALDMLGVIHAVAARSHPPE